MKPTNSLAPSSQKKIPFSSAITGDSLQNLIKKSVSSPESAARFTATLISAVASSKQLQNCKPATIVAAALRGEGMGLTLGREYHLIPFGDSCAYVIGYRGLIALCLAGNDVADMDCIEVREGEYVGRDKRTKRPIFDFSVYQTDEEAAQHKVIGYLAYVEMRDGYFRSEYMSVQDILNHAERYSKAFSIEKYNKLQNGELTPQEEDRLKSGSPYYSAPETMFKKTVIRRLLNSGYVRLANSAAIRDAMSYDTAVENDILPDLEMPDYTVVESTGEVVEAPQEAAEAPVAEAVEEKADTQPQAEAPRRRGRKPRAVEVTPDEDDAIGSFFGD